MRPYMRKPWVWVCLSLLGGGLIALVVAGCASILHGPLQPVAFTSAPTGANVNVDGENVGNTPVTTKLSRKTDHQVKIQMEGYQPFEMRIKKGIDGWFWGNLLLGGVIGMVVDGATGSMYKLTPQQIEGVLKKEGSSLRLGKDELLIGVTLSPDPAWEKIAELRRLGTP